MAETKTIESARPLSEGVAKRLLQASYAELVVRCPEKQKGALPDIASLFTKRELKKIAGFSRARVAELEAWMMAQNRRFRDPDESVDAAVCRLGFSARPNRRRRGFAAMAKSS